MMSEKNKQKILDRIAKKQKEIEKKRTLCEVFDKEAENHKNLANGARTNKDKTSDKNAKQDYEREIRKNESLWAENIGKKESLERDISRANEDVDKLKRKLNKE